MLYYLGGNGPWVVKLDGVVGDGISPPEDCSVQQVHMVRNLNSYNCDVVS